MGILNDTYHIVNNLSNHHEYVGAVYTLHMYDILKTAQIKNNNGIVNNDLFFNYDSYMFGLGDYPIYDESKRKELNDTIIRHFLMYEIGFETEYLFKIAMQAKMFSIMPKYNAMLSVINKMDEKNDITSTSADEITHDENRTTDNISKNRFSDTPQQNLNNIAVESGTEWVDKYLTTGNINDDKGHGTLNYTHKNNGRNMSYGKLLDEIGTDNFKIYEMICDELNNLFMGLFD